jgi:prophage regulatory protein
MIPNVANEHGTTAATLPQNVSDARLLPIEEVMTRCGKGRTAIYAGIKAGTFPLPAKDGRSSRWLSTEIDAWIVAMMASRSPAGTRDGRQ